VTVEDFVDEYLELQTGGTLIANKYAGYTLMIYMLNDSSFLRMVRIVI